MDGFLSKRLTPKNFPLNNFVSGISIPANRAISEYLYSMFPMSVGSDDERNLTIQSALSCFISTFGLAPPEEPPKFTNSSSLLLGFSFKIFSHSCANSSKSYLNSSLNNVFSG